MEPTNRQLARITNRNAQVLELPGEFSHSSGKLSKRQAAILMLIEITRRRAAIPLLDEGEELDIEISAWEDAVEEVPNQYLKQACKIACRNHDWTWPFRPDFIADAYRRLVVEQREHLEALRRAGGVNNCEHCRDFGGLGYQYVWVWHDRPWLKAGHWYLTARPCCCEFAPAAQRSEKPLEPPEFVKGKKSGQWVRLSDLTRAGSVPTDSDDFVIM